MQLSAKEFGIIVYRGGGYLDLVIRSKQINSREVVKHFRTLLYIHNS